MINIVTDNNTRAPHPKRSRKACFGAQSSLIVQSMGRRRHPTFFHRRATSSLELSTVVEAKRPPMKKNHVRSATILLEDEYIDQHRFKDVKRVLFFCVLFFCVFWDDENEKKLISQSSVWEAYH